MPRHVTESTALVASGAAYNGSNRTATENFVAALFGVVLGSPGRFATEGFLAQAKALKTAQQGTISWSHNTEVAALTDEWSTVTDTAGQLTISTATATAVHQGAKGMRFAATGVTTPAYVTKVGLNLPGTGWTSEEWFRIGSNWALSETYRDLQFLKIGNDQGDHIRIILNGAKKLKVDRTINSYLRISDAVVDVSPLVWHKITTKFTGGGTTDGGIEVLLDDVQVVAVTGQNFTGSGWKATKIQLGICDVGGTSHAGFFYFDDGSITGTGLVAAPTEAVAAPTNVVGVADATDQTVTLTWNDVADFNGANGDTYEVFETATANNGPVAKVSTNTRTSGRLAAGNYGYWVVAVVNGVRSPVSATASVTVGNTAPQSGATPVADAALAASWRTAKDTKSSSVIRQWFTDNVVFRGTVSGTHPGGTITTQAQADAMSGKTVNGDCYLSGTFTVNNVVFLGRRVEISNGANVTMTNCLIDGANQTFDADHITIRGKTSWFRVQVRKAQDGLKTLSGCDFTARYCMWAEASSAVGSLTGNQTHQDGNQHMAGYYDVEACFIDYQGNHSGGQGILCKADSARIYKFRFVDSFLTAGGNMLTFEATSNGGPDVIDLGTGDQRNVVYPGSTMINALSMYVNAAVKMPQSMQDQILKHSFFVADKGGTTLQWKNGITKSTLQNA